jgi:hypothetical protein
MIVNNSIDNTMTKGKGTKRQTTQWPIRVITKLPNSEQYDKGKVKTHKYIGVKPLIHHMIPLRSVKISGHV